MLYSLKDILSLSKKGRSAIAAFNVFGFEDARAVARAAQSENKPVILMANRDAVNHMGVKLICAIMRHEAELAKVPVCVHLDHAVDVGLIEEAVNCGFSSVMIDASRSPFEENVQVTRQVVDIARPSVDVEAEIGSVGYSDLGTNSIFTDPGEARDFALKTGVDALAVAVGTVHRMEIQEACLQFELLEKISSMLEVPIVIHGSTGVTDVDLKKLVLCGAQKINLGTTLRMAFGSSLRRQMDEDPRAFDRIKLFKKCMEAVEEKAAEKIRLIS